MMQSRLLLLVGPRSRPQGRDLRVLRVSRSSEASPDNVDSPRN
jgi:hypothetical protein